MLLSEEQIKEMVYRLDENGYKIYSDVETLQLIRTYIHERKGVDVGELVRPNGSPCQIKIGNLIQLIPDVHAMDMAFNDVIKYYSEKFSNEAVV